MNRIALFAFVKNECDFIGSFLDHNLQIADEATVIDNGSTDGTLEILKSYGDRIRLVEGHSLFGQKGRICLKWMLESDADILLPLDADELAVFDDGGKPDGDPRRAREYLLSLPVSKNDRFQTRRTFTKNPDHAGWWGVSASNKRFFARRGLLGVDCGFHIGRMEENQKPIPSDISYLHYHYRSREAWEKSTVQKLKARLGINWENPEVLKTYTGPSFHCAREYLIYKASGVWNRAGKQMFDERLDLHHDN